MNNSLPSGTSALVSRVHRTANAERTFNIRQLIPTQMPGNATSLCSCVPSRVETSTRLAHRERAAPLANLSADPRFGTPPAPASTTPLECHREFPGRTANGELRAQRTHRAASRHWTDRYERHPHARSREPALRATLFLRSPGEWWTPDTAVHSMHDADRSE